MSAQRIAARMNSTTEKQYSMSGDYAMEAFQRIARQHPGYTEPRITSESQIPEYLYMAICLQAMFHKQTPLQYVQAMQDELDCIYAPMQPYRGSYSAEHARRMLQDFPNRPPVWFYFLWTIHEYGGIHED